MKSIYFSIWYVGVFKKVRFFRLCSVFFMNKVFFGKKIYSDIVCFMDLEIGIGIVKRLGELKEGCFFF